MIKFEHITGDFFQLGKFGCVDINHIALITGAYWGSDLYELAIRGTNFRYTSVERFTTDELGVEILRIAEAIVKHKQENEQ